MLESHKHKIDRTLIPPSICVYLENPKRNSYDGTLTNLQHRLRNAALTITGERQVFRDIRKNSSVGNIENRKQLT